MNNLFSKIKSFFNSTIQSVSYVFSTGETISFSQDDLNKGLAFACSDVIASKVAMTDFFLIDKNGNRLDKHPFLDILKSPTSYLTQYDFLYLTTYYIILKGRAVYHIYKNEKKTNVLGLIPITNNLTNVEFSNGRIIYKFFLNNGMVEYEEKDVLDIRKINPFNLLNGFSVFEQARLELESDVISAIAYKKLNEKGALPSGIIESQTELSEEEANRIQAKVEDRLSGFKNFYKPLILGKNLQYKTLSFSPRDLAFIDVRNFTRDQILGIFKVPKAVLFANDVNRANSEAAKYWFIENTVKPYIDLIKDKLENDLLYKHFDVKREFKLSYENPVPEDKEYLLNRDDKLVNRVYTVNEIRKERGLDPIENGDYIYMEGIPIGTPITNEKSSNFNILKKRYIPKRNLEFEERKQKFTDDYINSLKEKIMVAQKLFFDKYLKKKTVFMSDKFLIEFKSNLQELEDTVYEILIKFNNENLYDEVLGNLNKLDKRFGNVNIKKEGLIEILKNRATKVADDFTNTIYNQSVNIIADYLKDKEEYTLKEVVNHLKENLSDDIDWRAERLARSEIVNGYNELEKQIIRSAKFVEKYEWLTAKDDRVCSICQSLDGKIINKYEDFVQGDHETAHPNCRCTILPVLP